MTRHIGRVTQMVAEPTIRAGNSIRGDPPHPKESVVATDPGIGRPYTTSSQKSQEVILGRDVMHGMDLRHHVLQLGDEEARFLRLYEGQQRGNSGRGAAGRTPGSCRLPRSTTQGAGARKQVQSPREVRVTITGGRAHERTTAPETSSP